MLLKVASSSLLQVKVPSEPVHPEPVSYDPKKASGRISHHKTVPAKHAGTIHGEVSCIEVLPGALRCMLRNGLP